MATDLSGLSVLVPIPLRSDGAHRDRAWEWTRKRWEALLPEAEIVVAHDDGGKSQGEFNQPQAINRAAAQASGDVLLMLETTFDRPEWVRLAVHHVRTGKAAWVLHSEYWKIAEDASEWLLNQPPDCDIPADIETEWIGKSASVAGMVVFPREAFDRVGGYDERFTWWGAHDVCWAAALRTLWGPPMRLPGRTLHFWHPVSLGETYGHKQHRRQHALMERYQAAEGDTEAMRRLVKEWQ